MQLTDIFCRDAGLLSSSILDILYGSMTSPQFPLELSLHNSYLSKTCSLSEKRILVAGWGNLACKIVKEAALLGLSRIILLCLSNEESAEVNIKELPRNQACECEITIHMLDYQVWLLVLKITSKTITRLQ